LGYAGEPDPDAIAQKIAATAYRRSIPNNGTEAVIILVQRGNGPRRGLPELPANIARSQAPPTFRPNIGDDWQDVVNTLDQSLSNEDSEQAMELVADLVAAVERLRRDRNVQELVLFWTTANLITHVIPKFKFMEWDYAQSQYVHLPMLEASTDSR